MKKFIFLFVTILFLIGCKNSNSNDIKSGSENINPIEKGNTMSDTLKSNDSTFVAIIKTNMGTIEIELFNQATPKTVENFVGLARKGYYKGIIFHFYFLFSNLIVISLKSLSLLNGFSRNETFPNAWKHRYVFSSNAEAIITGTSL